MIRRKVRKMGLRELPVGINATVTHLFEEASD
jgi:hypothetical protein